MILMMPYLRFAQSVRLAGESAAEEQTAEYRRAAFIGWQFASAQGALKNGTTFDKYLRSMNLQPRDRTKPRGTEIARERAEAHERHDRIRDAFRRK